MSKLSFPHCINAKIQVMFQIRSFFHCGLEEGSVSEGVQKAHLQTSVCMCWKNNNNKKRSAFKMLVNFGSEENKLWNECSMSAIFMGMLLKFQLLLTIINGGQFKIQMVNKASKQISKFGPQNSNWEIAVSCSCIGKWLLPWR